MSYDLQRYKMQNSERKYADMLGLLVPTFFLIWCVS